MRLLAPPLLVGPLLQEPRRARDRRTDRRQRRRVEVQQQTGQTTPGRGRRRGTGPRARQRVGVCRRRRRAVADPVVHQQADFRVREEVARLDALSVGRHDDHGARVRVVVGVRGQEGVVHQRDVRGRRAVAVGGVGRRGDGRQVQEACVLQAL